MNQVAKKYIDSLLGNENRIKAILIKGSMQNPETADFWSDTDIFIVLEEGIQIYKELYLQHLKSLGNVIAQETYFSTGSITLRSAIHTNSNIELLDITIYTLKEWLLSESKHFNSSNIIYGSIDFPKNKKQNIQHISHKYNNEHVEQIWYKYFMCIKKIVRNDNLIGLDLLMDLYKEYLVFEMIDRDIKYNSNIHRYGYNEFVPEKINVSLLDYTDKKNTLGFIKNLAYEYDKKLSREFKEYTSRYSTIEDYINESIKNLV